MVTLGAGMPLVGIGIVGVDAGNDVVATSEILLAVALRGERVALLDRLGLRGLGPGGRATLGGGGRLVAVLLVVEWLELERLLVLLLLLPEVLFLLSATDHASFEVHSKCRQGPRLTRRLEPSG